QSGLDDLGEDQNRFRSLGKTLGDRIVLAQVLQHLRGLGIQFFGGGGMCRDADCSQRQGGGRCDNEIADTALHGGHFHVLWMSCKEAGNRRNDHLGYRNGTPAAHPTSEQRSPSVTSLTRSARYDGNRIAVPRVFGIGMSGALMNCSAPPA